MQHRCFEVICVSIVGLLACSSEREPGAEVAASAGGSQTDSPSTGVAAQGATPITTHTRTGSATIVAGQGGSASSSEAGGASARANPTSYRSSSGGSLTSSTASGGTSPGSFATKSSTSATGGASWTKQNGSSGAVLGGSTSQSSTGSTTHAGGSAATTPKGYKRGIAANIAPGAEFNPSVAWWYNWAMRSTGSNVGIEFVPMVWGEASVSSAIPSGSKYLLGFNEPNFFAQANLSAAEAASLWPKLQANAISVGVKLVGPGMNYCGPASQCHGTDPYVYLKDFFSACTDCSVDYVAVHWYNCDLPSLRDYLEPGGNLPGFEQFGKPIWLTEFSCDEKATIAQQEAYMRAAIPYLEGNPNVARYSWFSADPIPNARLIDSDGSPTALGQVYINLAAN